MGYTEEVKELEVKRNPEILKNDFGGFTTSPIKYAQPKRHRNDPCSCGSGKKFKNCCELKLKDGKCRHYYAGKKQ